MAAPQVLSDEQLFQLTGSWEAAAALRDEQNRALNEYNWSQQQAAPTAGGMLTGNILAGASWNSLNPTLAAELTAATGQQTSNYAVGGATTADTLNQLNTFISGGGTFDPNATVFLQTGGVDFIQGVDKDTVKSNITQIVKTLADQGVNVVLTGSPYAASVQDVIDNKFNPEVDSLFKDIAKENSNVALVNTQGEILKNKDLLVDALHTNAAGTAIYNQSVMDALSQFKNEVPPSTPQAITQAQRSGVIPTARGTVIEGDDIEAQMAGVPQVVYETRVDPNNPANWETYNPNTGEVINRGTFAGGGDRGLLAAAAPVIGLAASTVGLPFISGALGGLTGATGSTLAGLTGATIGGGTTAVAGGSSEDILKAALLGGGGSFLGSELQNALYDSTAAADLAGGLDPRYGGSNPLYGTKYDAAMSDLLSSAESQKALADYINGVTTPTTTTPVAVSTPVTDGGVLNITGTTTPALNVGGLLGGAITPTVSVTGAKTPEQVDQSVINLINNQLSTNAKAADQVANVNVTAQKPANAQEIVSAITSTIPNITTAQANTIAEQVITSGKPVTTQEVISAITSSLPIVTTPTTTTPVTPEVKVTAQRPTTVGDTLAAFPSTLVNTTTTTPTTSEKTNELGLTDAQMANLLKAGLGLFGTLGATSVLSNMGTTTNPVGLPTQLPPMYTDDYFTKVQQNYNRLLPAVPRDVATPLRDWYTSQYGA